MWKLCERLTEKFRPMQEYTITSVGDQGDLCALMPLARHLKKAAILVFDSPMCKPITKPDRFNAIKTLVESQPYISRFAVWQGEPVTHPVANWRDGGVEFGKNLCSLHSEWVGMKVNQSPWLKVKPDKRFKDKIVINRSTRHRSDLFPWTEVMRHFKKEDLVFIGLEEEAIQHRNEFGVDIAYHKTENLLECAQIIQASKLFIGNQSCNVNIAIGLGKRFVLECSLTSVDCLYHRPDSIYVTDGSMVLDVDGYPPLVTKSLIPEREMCFSTSAPGGFWKYVCKDGFEIKEVTGFDTHKMANKHEREIGLPLSTKGDITQQMSVYFPTFGQNCYTNWLIDRIFTVKELINKVQYGNR